MSTDARDTFRHWARRMLFHHHRMERSPEAASEVYQTSTMAALLDGIFREVTVAELLTHGDFKVGTFNHLDGEMVVLHGTCHHLRSDVNGMSGYVRTRTVMAQPPPYQPMTTVTADEPITEFRNMPGDLVGFRTPEFEQGISVAGYHLHFLNETRNRGGHALDFELLSGRIEISTSSELHLSLPRTQPFLSAKLSQEDIAEQIHGTEGG